MSNSFCSFSFTAALEAGSVNGARRSSILCITHSGEGNVQIDVYDIVITGGHQFSKSSWSVHSNIFSIHDLMFYCAKSPPLGGHRL